MAIDTSSSMTKPHVPFNNYDIFNDVITAVRSFIDERKNL